VNGLKHQKEKRSMDHFAGLDVSVKATSVCIVDDSGQDRSGSEGGERAGSVIGGAEEPRLPASDIDTAAADSLKVLDPKRPIREADMQWTSWKVRLVPVAKKASGR
jgi:hypothetical protein